MSGVTVELPAPPAGFRWEVLVNGEPGGPGVPVVAPPGPARVLVRAGRGGTTFAAAGEIRLDLYLPRGASITLSPVCEALLVLTGAWLCGSPPPTALPVT